MGCFLLVTSSLAYANDCALTRIVVGRAPGGGTDALARLIAQNMTTRSGKSVIVENKVGAGGNIAAAIVAKAAPDGCTLLLTGNWHTVNQLIYSQPGYEEKDFAPVLRMAEGTTVLTVNAEQPFKNVAALVAYAKANPGRLSYSSSGIGSNNHLAMELFLQSAGIDITHVPYKGAGPAMQDTISNVVAMSMSGVTAALPFISSGKLRPIAVTSPERWPTLPDVPTMRESGYPAASHVVWMGMLAPSATPLKVREQLNAELRGIVAEKAVSDIIRGDGYEPIAGTASDFDAFLKQDLRAMQKIMSQVKLKVE
jgi:tripartite-type tricarboxylate transporter receptor subunit TctC